MSDALGTVFGNDVIAKNMKDVCYKKFNYPVQERVVSMATVNNYVILGTTENGCRIYKVEHDYIDLIGEFALDHSSGEGRSSIRGSHSVRGSSKGTTCSELYATEDHVAYIKDYNGASNLCLHNFSDLLDGDTTPLLNQEVLNRAPLIIDSSLGYIVIGSAAWKNSWTTAQGELKGEAHVRVLNIENLEIHLEFQASKHNVSILRHQVMGKHNLLGVGDKREGINVYDMRTAKDGAFQCLYTVPVEEIRNFELCSNFLGVFHKFEPNVTFWNMSEERTILCINIQDQMKQLAEEYCDDEDGDSGLFDDEDDHVTAVKYVKVAKHGQLLIYGTKSGCIFGMSVETRSRVFSIPYPHEADNPNRVRRNVQGLTFTCDGKLIACFESTGLNVLNFNVTDPPDRPPTRGVAK